jgi:hypothetical protein
VWYFFPFVRFICRKGGKLWVESLPNFQSSMALLNPTNFQAVMCTEAVQFFLSGAIVSYCRGSSLCICVSSASIAKFGEGKV